ncbi:uncharacterized protein DUF4199 [Flavobacterium croceum DSM 17960]|uniref:Uncharacterized protein DUF4199 n=1 Tax=Flavobacterium croceum DSM 17960 TaxID=1121886 RepID=A0A2S4N889_9FLAO|nr:DUF4199 domain-containing protein [Flavobacterium croceum]POS01935.1 uncharacterized protein DUF4199 [Flavobacterium croceum DSM 17960]
MKNSILKNGIISGILVSMFMVCMTIYMKYNPTSEPSMIVGFTSMILAFSFVFIGIKQQKQANNGSISFIKAFTTGFLIALIASVMYVIVWLFIYYNFFPNFIEHYSQMMIDKAKPEDVATVTAEMNQYKEWYKSPVMIILLTFMEILPLGVLVSLLGALLFSVILKKKN